jgi:hypothetical protein
VTNSSTLDELFPEMIHQDMSHSEPLSTKSLAPGGHLTEDEEEEMIDAENEAEGQPKGDANAIQQNSRQTQETRPPRETRKDRDLHDFLNDMDKYVPIVPPSSPTYSRPSIHRQ